MNNNEWYLKKLYIKNIKVMPLENYKGKVYKILHKCICGNEWNVTPTGVLAGNRCGCKQIGVIKKTHKNYLNDLNENNIKVIPLENYKGSTIKILHKCICNNEWKVKPNAVLNGSKCGCESRPKKSHKWYLDKLKEKEIKVYPLETYIDMKSSIKHKCYCGNEWNCKPMLIIQGSGCGCKKNYSLRGVDFYKNKETLLYYIKILGLWKIGVTLYNESIKKSLKKRFYKEYDLIEEIIKTEVFKDGSIAFNLEQQILNYNWAKKYKGDKVLISGNTELFKDSLI